MKLDGPGVSVKVGDPYRTIVAKYKREHGWGAWVWKQKLHAWERVVANELINMGIHLDLIGTPNGTLGSQHLAMIKTQAGTLIQDAIYAADLPRDFWQRWEVETQQNGVAVLVQVKEKP
jgi:hypothetical protein